MEQVINPNANSDKYILETESKISAYDLKLKELETKYANTIKEKDALISQKESLSSTRNSDIISLNDRIRNQEATISSLIDQRDSKQSQISNLESQLSQRINAPAPKTSKPIQVFVRNSYLHNGGQIESLCSPFTLKPNTRYFVSPYLFFQNRSPECKIYLRIKQGGSFRIHQMLYTSKQETASNNVIQNTSSLNEDVKIPYSYDEVECDIVWTITSSHSRAFSQINNSRFTFIEIEDSPYAIDARLS